MDGDTLAELMFHDPTMMPSMGELPDEQLQIMAGNRIALGVYTWDPYMHNPKLPYRLHRVNIPTHFIWGKSDGVVSVAYGQGFCKMIKDATMTVIDEAGHAPHMEQPDRFVQAVSAFTD